MPPGWPARGSLPAHQCRDLTDSEPVALRLLPVRLDSAKQLGSKAVGEELAAKLGAKHSGDLRGSRDNAASGRVEGDVDLRDIHWFRLSRQ